MNALYWACLSLYIVDASLLMTKKLSVIEYVLSCLNEDGRARPMEVTRLTRIHAMFVGGFSQYPGGDSHLLATLSAIQVLKIFDCISMLPKKPVIDCMSCLSRMHDTV